MKAKTYIQYNQTEVIAEDIVKVVKEDLKSQEIKMVNIDTLNMYYKPQEASCYYVATLKDGKEVQGSVKIG
ncbi:hypothetical protein BN3662_02361 [Clostridiales bacterium CHKCI006]|nr:hypothetical protein BN3662_02361 [Clostridiales bacterium CHKCI006]